ncbi:hypothetical protein MRB53_040030 [Persea americana]|nr:hypothetical protein MRB53_040030 [Persea americana]
MPKYSWKTSSNHISKTVFSMPQSCARPFTRVSMGNLLMQLSKSAICAWLMAHATTNGSKQVQHILLTILQKIKKVASDSRKAYLLPQLQKLISNESSTLKSPEDAFSCLTHRSTTELEVLKEALHCNDQNLRNLAAQTLSKLFNKFKTSDQTELANWLFDSALKDRSTHQSQDSSDLLQDLNLSVPTISALLLKAVSKIVNSDTERPSKRARTSKGAEDASTKQVDPEKFNAFIRATTLCLSPDGQYTFCQQRYISRALHHSYQSTLPSPE